MFIRKFSCVTRCIECGAVAQKTIIIAPFPISDIGAELLDLAPACTNCKGTKLEVRNIECAVMPDYDEFGAKIGGEWQCPFGHNGSHYPASMRRAFQGDLVYSTQSEFMAKYIGMKNMGYPPRCTNCKAKLIYAEDSNSGGNNAS